MKKLEHSWEFFMSENSIPKTIRPAVYQSWKRCQDYNVDPLQKQAPVILSEDEINELINQSQLYHISQPIIERLYNQIQGTEHLITLSDENGRIIHLKGDNHIQNKAQEMNFIIGADWSEKVAGSNAIGTAIASNEPIQIFSFEHYCEGVHPWVCSAAPIKDPLTKKVLGVIDLTGPSEIAQSHSLSVVQSISSLIEQQLLKNSSRKLTTLQEKYEEVKRKHQFVNVIVLDEMLHVVRADEKCLSLLRINEWDRLWEHPEMKQLKRSLLDRNINLGTDELEWDWDIEELQVKIFIREVTLDSKRIGYCLCFEKLYQFNPSDPSSKSVFQGIIGNSKQMNQIIDKAKVVAKTDVPVLITGESGTGKEVLSFSVHQGSSRKDEPYISINCGAIPRDLIASELFGYEAGTFTGADPKGKKGKFEEANGGTLLLDEIGEMPLELQVNLLRVLQEKEIVRLGSSKPIPIDVRVIAATNKNLKESMEKGVFRSDLYFRLNVVELHLPPLRERAEDIPLLSQYFVKELAKTHGKQVPTIDHEVLTLFSKYHWPGNIRELMNVMEYAILFSANKITLETLPKSIKEFQEQEVHSLSVLELEEKKEIKRLLVESNGNLSEVARRCGIARTTLYRKIKKYNLG